MNVEMCQVFEGWLKIVKLPKDGNCLFNALLHQLILTKQSVNQFPIKNMNVVRHTILDFVLQYLDSFKEYLLVEACEAYNLNFLIVFILKEL